MIFIPKTIHVGFGHPGWGYNSDRSRYKLPRPETELGFVIYEDEKGKLRQQPSWDSWRDKDVDPKKFDNVPTAGFMINKAAGGQRYSWEKRQNYARVYDPRGWEFEITMENLVFLLKATGYDKENGFGPVVYAWDKGKLVVLPTNSMEYENSVRQTKTVFDGDFIKPENFVVGNVYRRRSEATSLYLGRFQTYSPFDLNSISGDNPVEQKYKGMQHWFVGYSGSGSPYLWASEANPVSSPGKTFVEDLGPVSWPIKMGWMNDFVNGPEDVIERVKLEDTRIRPVKPEIKFIDANPEDLEHNIKTGESFSAYFYNSLSRVSFVGDRIVFHRRGWYYGQHRDNDTMSLDEFYAQAKIKVVRFNDGGVYKILPKTSLY